VYSNGLEGDAVIIICVRVHLSQNKVVANSIPPTLFFIRAYSAALELALIMVGLARALIKSAIAANQVFVPDYIPELCYLLWIARFHEKVRGRLHDNACVKLVPAEHHDCGNMLFL
jgi:hypothetical protein